MGSTESEDRRSFIFDPYLLVLFISCKIIVVGSIIFFFVHFDMCHTINLWNRHYSGNLALNSLYFPFSNWDGQYYLLLADKGYGTFEPSNAFFPLFPFLIRLVNLVTLNIYVAAFVVNIVLSYFFMVFFYNYVREFCTRESSLIAALFVLAYPSAFFMTVFYSEALFLFLLFGFLYFYKRRSYWSLAFIVLLPLSRGQSLFVFVALIAALLWTSMRKRTAPDFYELSNLAIMPVGFVLYILFMYFATGSVLSGMEAQNKFVFGNALINAVNPFHFIKYLLTPTTDLFAYNHAIIDKIFIIIIMVCIPVVIKSKNPLMICIFISLAYFPASLGNGGSYVRHSLLAIPFLSVAALSYFPKGRMVIGIATVLSAALQMYLILRFSLNVWVA